MTDQKKSNIPENWSRTRLADICEIIRGVTYKKVLTSDSSLEGYLPILRATNIQENHLVLDKDLIFAPQGLVSEKQQLREGDIVVATSSGSIHLVGKTAQIKKSWSGSFGAFCAAIRPSSKIDHHYLGYFFESREYKDFIAKQALGVNINNLRRGDLEEISVPVAPLEQQKRIVAEIEKQFSRLDEAVANLKRVKANLKRYKAAILKAAVEGKLTEEWRKQHPDIEPASKFLERIKAERREQWKGKGKYKEPTDPDTTNLPLLPEGWVWASLEAVTDAIGGFTFKSKEFTANGYQIVKMANIKMGKLDLSQRPSYIENVPEDIIEKYQLVEKDILVTLTGTRKKRDYGYVVQIKEPENSLLLNQRIARLRPYISETSGFVTLALQSEVFRNLFFKHETGNVGQGNVGMKAVTSEPIPLPSLNEQTEIIEEYDSKLSVILKVEAVVDTNMHRAERLRQSILMNAFSGRFVS